MCDESFSPVRSSIVVMYCELQSNSKFFDNGDQAEVVPRSGC